MCVRGGRGECVREKAGWTQVWGRGSAPRSVGGAEARAEAAEEPQHCSPPTHGTVVSAVPALAPAAWGRSVEGDSGRNEVPFNLGEQRELLTCHWHPLILERKKSASQQTPQEGAPGEWPSPPRLSGVKFPSPRPAPPLLPAPPPQTARRRPASQWEALNLQPRLQITAGSVRRAAAPDKIDYFSPLRGPPGKRRGTRVDFCRSALGPGGSQG